MSDITYTIQPIDGLGHYFAVDLVISKPHPDGQVLQMPSWIPGSYMIRDFSKQIVSIAAFRFENKKLSRALPQRSTKNLPLKQLNSDTWQLEPHTGPVLVRSRVYAYDHSVRTAYLDQVRGFFNFSSLCLQVVGQTTQPINCFILSTPLTKNWEVITSLPKQVVNSKGFGQYLAKDYDALIDHPVSLGHFTKIRWQSHGIPHLMVLQGTTRPLNTQQLQRDLKAISEAQIAFFDPKSCIAPFDQYIFHVNVIGNGYGGLEHRASTALLCKRSDLIYQDQSMTAADLKAYQDFLGLCSHEYFHAWMIKKVQPKAFQPYRLNARNYTQLLWLFEGFTSYYDDLHLLRSGRIDKNTYLQRLLDTHHQVQRNPGRHHQSVAQSSFDAWTKYYLMDENTPNAVVSYYAKGALIAMALDVLIRDFSHQSQSLDDVMRLIWRTHGAHADTVGQGMAEDGMDQILLKVLGQHFMPHWRVFKSHYIDGTQDIDIQAVFVSAGIPLKEKVISVTEDLQYLLGIRTNVVEQSLKITHVLEGYLAHHAGLCPNDIVIALNQERVTAANWLNLLSRLSKQPSQPIVFTVFRNDLLHTLVLKLPKLTKNNPLMSKMYTLAQD